MLCLFLLTIYWAGLQNSTDRMMLEQGVELLQKEVLAQHAGGTRENEGAPRRLTAGDAAHRGGADGDEETGDATEGADMEED